MSDKITAPCEKGPRAAHNSGPRTKKQIAFHVIHASEGDSAAGVAAYLHGKNSGGSVQRCLDDKECIRILPDLVIPWGAPPLNTSGIHDELSAFSRWSPLQWYKHLPMLKREGSRIAFDCITYKIPLRWLTAVDLKQIGTEPGVGKGGVTDHVAVTKAFGKTDHTDPGQGFELSVEGRKSPHKIIMFWARHYYKQMKAKA